jgi:hypothetical protein
MSPVTEESVQVTAGPPRMAKLGAEATGAADVADRPWEVSELAAGLVAPQAAAKRAASGRRTLRRVWLRLDVDVCCMCCSF